MGLTEDERNLLDSIYLSPDGISGSFGSLPRLFEAARAQLPSLKKQDVEAYLTTVKGYSRHARVVRKFLRRSFLSYFPFEYVQIDIGYMDSLKNITSRKVYNTPSYALFCICVFSRYCLAEPLNRKRPIDVLTAFKKMTHTMKRLPEKISKDEGGEWEGEFAKWCLSNGIKLYSTTSLTKAAICEAAIYRIKTICNRIQTQYNSNDWAKFLPQAVKIFNNEGTKALPNHMSPSDGIKPSNTPAIQKFIFEKRANLAEKEKKLHPKPKFSIGDRVRFVLAKAVGPTLSTRGFKPRFSESIHEIKAISNTLPRQYFIGVYKNKKPRYFYAKELKLAAEREGDQVSVLRIIKYRDKVVSYLRSGKPRETIREYLTVLSNAERPKFLTEEQLFSYKNGQSSLASFKNGGSVG